MCRWVICFILNNHNVESLRGNVLNLSMGNRSILKIRNVKSIRGGFFNVSVGHSFH